VSLRATGTDAVERDAAAATHANDQAQRLDPGGTDRAQAQQLEVMQLQVARVLELERTVRASLMKSQYENRRADKL